jgi:hypothetical protein
LADLTDALSTQLAEKGECDVKIFKLYHLTYHRQCCQLGLDRPDLPSQLGWYADGDEASDHNFYLPLGEVIN